MISPFPDNLFMNRFSFDEFDVDASFFDRVKRSELNSCSDKTLQRLLFGARSRSAKARDARARSAKVTIGVTFHLRDVGMVKRAIVDAMLSAPSIVRPFGH